MTLSAIWPRGPDKGRLAFERSFDASRLRTYWDEFRKEPKFPDEPSYRALTGEISRTTSIVDKRLYMLNNREDVHSWLVNQRSFDHRLARLALYELIDEGVSGVFGTHLRWLPIFLTSASYKEDCAHSIWLTGVQLYFPVISYGLLDDMYAFWKRRLQ